MSAPASTRPPRATAADLAAEPGKAELVGGRIVRSTPTGHRPNVVAGNIFFALKTWTRRVGGGTAYTDNVGVLVPELASGRESFSPDVSFRSGPAPADGMNFVQGPPDLAVEVRSKNDQGEAAERVMAAKRRDYFEAGTVVVWDVDPVAEVVRIFRTGDPDRAETRRRGESADAEPVLGGWRAAVDEIFD